MSDSALATGRRREESSRRIVDRIGDRHLSGRLRRRRLRGVAPAPRRRRTSRRNRSAGAPPAQPSTIVDLPPIVTNLGAPQDTWIRLEGSIIFDPKTLPHPEAVAGQIGDDVLAYLRTVSLHQLEGPIGLENIRQDLNERAATRSGGKVREFVIRTLVVQ